MGTTARSKTDQEQQSDRRFPEGSTLHKSPASEASADCTGASETRSTKKRPRTTGVSSTGVNVGSSTNTGTTRTRVPKQNRATSEAVPVAEAEGCFWRWYKKLKEFLNDTSSPLSIIYTLCFFIAVENSKFQGSFLTPTVYFIFSLQLVIYFRRFLEKIFG